MFDRFARCAPLASAGFLMLFARLDAQESRAAEPDTLVRRVAAEMEGRYVFPDVGRRVAAQLRAATQRGAYRRMRADEALATRLTAELRAATGDGHLTVEYTATPLPGPDSAAEAEMNRRDRVQYYGPQLNFGFSKVEILPGNVGYIDVRVFAPLDWGAPTATAAMTFVAHTEALVIDLRRNGGGHGEMVQWLISYLMGSEPRPLSGEYSRARDATVQSWTLPWVPGPRFGPTKPVYVLTSRRTFSAAEAFAYNLQALRRAIVVGESTAGGAHPYENVKLDAHFVLGLPTSRSVNPITGGNWQGTGVRPDVAVPADSALAVALRLTTKGS
jgi:C-terminal processing protease CtpA/Prc